MILPQGTRERDTIEYPIGIERAVEQYLYGTNVPWFYISAMAIAICRRMPGLKVIFFSDDPTFADIVRKRGHYYWSRPSDRESVEEEYDLYVSGSNGTALYPGTRWGLQNAAELIYLAHGKRWCRLTLDCEFRRRLLNATLNLDNFVEEVGRTWLVGIWSDWEDVTLFTGPQFHRLDESIVDAAIAETNEQCI